MSGHIPIANYYNLDEQDNVRKAHILRYYIAKGFLGKNDTVLDIGCGVGYGCHMLSQQALKVIGVDNDIRCVNAAKQVYAKNNIEFIHHDIQNYNMKKFDIITAFESLEHLNKPYEVIDKMMENANKFFLISTPNIVSAGINSLHKHDLFAKDLSEYIISKGKWNHIHPLVEGISTICIYYRKETKNE